MSKRKINDELLGILCELEREGVIPIKDLDVKYEYNYDQKSIKVFDTNKYIFIGDKIHVNLYDVSLEYRELYFTFDFLWKKELQARRLEKFKSY